MKTPLSSQLFRAAAPILAIGISCLSAQENSGEPAVEALPWSQADTRLANHYIQLLQKEPAYGNVLNLLWDLYRKKEQTELLLEYFSSASESGGVIPDLLYAHLLRKNEQLDEAREVYDSVLDQEESNAHAIRALAEIADRQKRFSKALSLYNRLVELVPVEEEDGIGMRLRKATLHRLQGQRDEAVATWNELLAAHPNRVDLRNQIVSLLLEAGATDSALSVLENLASSKDPREKLEALTSLTRLYEFISDFDGAVDAANRGLELLHYKNHGHAELFAQLVQIHERFERLADLETALGDSVSDSNPTEKALYQLAEFYRITANPTREAEVVKRLVERVPSDLTYRIRLVRAQMRNDRYEDAADTLETALADQPEVPLHLVLLRAEIALGAENQVEAEEVVTDHLEQTQLNSDEVNEVIEFARNNYLDNLVEKLLRDTHSDKLAGSDGVSAPIELARFLYERGRKGQGRQTLEDFVAGADEGTIEQARRLFLVSVSYRELEEIDRALDAVERALAITPGNEVFLTGRADLLVEAGRIEEAITQLESLWTHGESFDDRADIDQRLFSLLRGHYSNDPDALNDDSVLQNGNIQTLAQYRRMAAAVSRANRASDEPPPAELVSYYDRIKDAANKTPTTELRYRAAWWAFKLLDNQECYQQLTRANEEAGKPVLEIEKLLLELAIQNERPTLMVDHLTTLAEIDPDNADDYLQQRAEKRFELGFEDEAIRELQRLAAKPDASLETLNTLAKVYQRQGSVNKQIAVWQRAYRDANVFEKRRIVKQLSTALIESGNPQSAIEAQLELIEKETDLVQRRKQLDTQLTAARSHFLLEWLLGRYRELSQQNPFDRFYPEALARVHRAAGEDREAFEAMKKAYYMSDSNDALLDELGQLADSLGDLKSAIYYRRQLLAREEGSSLENWQTLIEMLEKDLRVDEARLLRKRLESRFGRDPEFLARLTDHYLDNAQFSDAERTLLKLVELRPWDRKSRFRLGQLKRERGEYEEAFALFESLIDDTRDVPVPEDLAQRAVPLIRVSTLTDENRSASGHELDEFIFSVENYPFLGGDLQDVIAEALQEAHPEFHYDPDGEAILRLRSIEEAGSLARKTGRSDAWLKEHLDDSLPLHERLWAARHAGDGKTLSRLLSQRPASDSHFDLLVQAWGLLLAQDVDGLEEWAATDLERDEGRFPRSRYAVMAAFLLLKDAPADPLRDESVLLDALARLPVHPTVARHVFAELRKEGHYEIALAAGTRFAEDPLREDGKFLFELSQVAGWAGYREQRIEWLDQSLLSLSGDSGTRVAGHFYTALTERLSLLPDDVARNDYLERVASVTRTRPELNPSDQLERSLLLSLAAGRNDEAISSLDELMRRQIDFIRPRSPDLDQVRYDQSQSWQRMNQLLRFYAERIPLTAKNRDSLLGALSGRPLSPPLDESVLAEFEQFEIDRRLLSLDTLGAVERDSLVDSLHRTLVEPDSSLELAKSLENFGYYREAIPVYRIEAMRRDRDYAPLQGLFEACNEALEPTTALAVIEQIEAREFPAPPGLTSDYLAEQHARFLLLSRNLERLVPLSRPPSAGKGAPPITTTAHFPYQAALVEAYRVMGRDDALFRLLTYLRDRKEIDSRQLLLGAEVLQRQGDLARALEWARAVPLNQSEPELERQAISMIVKLHQELHPDDGAPLVELARTSLSQHPSLLTRKIAAAAARSGSQQEAAGILELLRRESSDPVQRFAITTELLQLARDRGSRWEELREEWEAWFQLFHYEPNLPEQVDPDIRPSHRLSNVARFAEWLLEEDDHGELSALLAEITAPVTSAWFHSLLRASLENRVEPEARALISDADPKIREQILETLPSFGEAGVTVSRALVEESSLPGTRCFSHQPVRQIAFFERIGDRSRLLEIHETLMREARSDLFHQGGLDKWFPTLTTRYEMPRLFAELGEQDLAARLFDRYHETLGPYRWNHEPFLEDYVRFLLAEEDFGRAETILKNAFQKSIRLDLRLLLELYAAWGKLDEWESRTADLFLSEGRIALLHDWRTALAEGREMVEYSDTW